MTTPGPVDIAGSRLPLTAHALAPVVPSTLARVEVVPASPSTNTRLFEAARSEPQAWPHLSALVADHQTAGRGRAGRTWVTPRGAALTASFLLRPDVARADYGWAPLVAGLAAVRALCALGIDAWLKWPNDVVVEAGGDDVAGWGRWRKCVGILCEAVPGDDAVVAGIGINVSQGPSELPVPHAASLATLGATDLDRVALFRALAAELRDAVGLWRAGGDIRREVERVTATLGWDVAVDVPDGPPVTGRAVGLTEGGALVVRTPAGDERVVLAGDVRVRRG